MTGIMGPRTAGPTAAIANIVGGVQAQGVWAGRRQLFVRFAAEAETATLYTPDMLARHLERGIAQPTLHSISLTGYDPLASVSLLSDAFAHWKPQLPVMLDSDGQRPEALPTLCGTLSLVQVTIDFAQPASFIDRALETIAATARAGCQHAAVLTPGAGTSDGQILRFVEQAHGVSPGTKIVVHPPPGAERVPLDRRYGTLLEQATAIHRDVWLALRIPAPVGMR